jgi:hypothetical protein
MKMKDNIMTTSEIEQALALFGPSPVMDIKYPSQTIHILHNENVESFAQNVEIFNTFKARLNTVKKYLLTRTKGAGNSGTTDFTALDILRKEAAILVLGDTRFFKNGSWLGTCRLDCPQNTTTDTCFTTNDAPCTQDQIDSGGCLRSRNDRANEIPVFKQFNGLMMTRIFINKKVYAFTVDKTYPYKPNVNVYKNSDTNTTVTELSEIVAQCTNPDSEYACFLDANQSDSCDFANNTDIPFYTQPLTNCKNDPNGSDYTTTIYNIYQGIMSLYEQTCLQVQAKNDPYEIWKRVDYYAENRCVHRGILENNNKQTYSKTLGKSCRSAYDNKSGLCVIKTKRVRQENCTVRKVDPTALLRAITKDTTVSQMPTSN